MYLYAHTSWRFYRNTRIQAYINPGTMILSGKFVQMNYGEHWLTLRCSDHQLTPVCTSACLAKSQLTNLYVKCSHQPATLHPPSHVKLYYTAPVCSLSISVYQYLLTESYTACLPLTIQYVLQRSWLQQYRRTAVISCHAQSIISRLNEGKLWFCEQSVKR